MAIGFFNFMADTVTLDKIVIILHECSLNYASFGLQYVRIGLGIKNSEFFKLKKVQILKLTPTCGSWENGKR